MSKKNKENVIVSQKEANKICKESKEKQKKKKKKANTKNDKKTLVISIALVIILIVIMGSIIAYVYVTKTIVKDELVIETGNKIPSVDDYFKKIYGNKKNYKITYENIDSKASERNEIKTTKIYIATKNIKNEKNEVEHKINDIVEKEIAISNNKIKDGFKEQIVIKGTGIYNVTITDMKTEKTYISTLKVIDTEKPKITMKDSFEVEQNTPVSPTDFIEKYSDNSNDDLEIYFAKEDKDKNTKKITYSKIESINTEEIKEQEITLLVKDKSSNKTIGKSKLIVKEKPQEEPTEEMEANESSTGSGSRSGGNYSRNSGGYSGGNSGGSSGGASSGPLRTSGGTVVTQGQLFAYWGPGGYSSAKRQNALAQFNSIFPNLPDVSNCDRHFGNTSGAGMCVDWSGPQDVYDSNWNIVGLYSPFTMTNCPDAISGGSNCPTVGEGYLLPSGVVYRWKNY